MPNTIVDIPGVGEVEFPDTMSEDAVNAASKKLHDEADVAVKKAATPTDVFHLTAGQNASGVLGGMWDRVKEMGSDIAANIHKSAESMRTGKYETKNQLPAMASYLTTEPYRIGKQAGEGTPEAIGKSVVDTAAYIPAVLGMKRTLPDSVTPASTLKVVKAVASHPATKAAAEVVGGAGLGYIEGGLPHALIGATGGGVLYKLLKAAKEMREGGGPTKGGPPHMPTAEGYDQFMPNESAPLLDPPAPSSEPLIRSAQAETDAVLDRHMPNQSASSHVADNSMSAAGVPPLQNMLDLVDRYMANQSGVPAAAEPVSIGAGRTPYGVPDPVGPPNPNAGGVLGGRHTPAPTAEDALIDALKKVEPSPAPAGPGRPNADGLRTAEANAHVIEQMKERGLTPAASHVAPSTGPRGNSMDHLMRQVDELNAEIAKLNGVASNDAEAAGMPVGNGLARDTRSISALSKMAEDAVAAERAAAAKGRPSLVPSHNKAGFSAQPNLSSGEAARIANLLARMGIGS